MWEKFIRRGFSKESDCFSAKKYLSRYAPSNDILEDDLHLSWFMKKGVKNYTVVCSCGNRRMLVHERGIRCHSCGRFHSHDNFQRMKLKARAKAKFDDGQIQKNPQPFIEAYQKNYGIRSR